MSPTLSGVVDNQLLAALPVSERCRILSSCESVELAQAELLYSPCEPMEWIYFPTSSFISLIMPSGDSVAFEVGMIGNEGMLGTGLALNTDTSAEQAIVRGAGSALRMSAAALRREFRRSEVLRGEIGRYIHVRMHHLAQAAICANYHSLEGRVACRLLMTQDRVGTNSFNITQDILASKLGVRRAGVTRAASALKRRRLIRYSRGDITLLDRRGLMTASCSCYRADRESRDRVRGHGSLA